MSIEKKMTILTTNISNYLCLCIVFALAHTTSSSNNRDGHTLEMIHKNFQHISHGNRSIKIEQKFHENFLLYQQRTKDENSLNALIKARSQNKNKLLFNFFGNQTWFFVKTIVNLIFMSKYITKILYYVMFVPLKKLLDLYPNQLVLLSQDW